MTGLTAIAKLAGLWVDHTANINGNYAISDKALPNRNGSRSTSSIKLSRPPIC